MDYAKENLVVSGKRKRAIAKATLRSGEGKITINKIPYENLAPFHKLLIKEPIEIAKKIIGGFSYNIAVSVRGGGKESQIEASRLSIAKALVKATKSDELRSAFLNYDKNLLVADVRRKEPYKPGDSKARSKRQKSFR